MRLNIKLLALLTILPALAPLTANFPVLLTASPAWAQTSNTTQPEANQLLQLTGTQEPNIELLKGLSLGAERIRKAFQDSGWTFYTNGTFTFIPQFGTPIFGTYAKVGDKFDFQGEQLLQGTSGVSIDGTIRINGDNIVLDAIYTNWGFSFDVQQIVRISQSLAKGGEMPKPKPIQNSETSAGTEQAKLPDDLRRELEQLGKEIEGIKIPSLFKISLEGKTNEGSFGPLSGTLYIGKAAAGSQHPLSVDFMTLPELFGKNGVIVVRSEDANATIQVNKGQVRLEFSPSEVMRSSFYTLSPSANPPTVLLERAILTFSIEGDRISGEIRASGLTGEYLNQPSTYEAKLTGEIPKSLPVEKLRAALTTSSFNGQWDAGESGFGRIELQQIGQKVKGTYTGRGGGTIEGLVRGNRIDFTWQDRQQGKGWGFFRAIAGGGKLTGLWGNTNSQNNSQSLVAIWQIPSFLATENFSSFDMQELKYLGQALVGKSRCEQAVPLLDKAVTFYKLEQQNQPLEIFPPALNAGTSLISLIKCNLMLGNYDQLLENLDNGLEVQRIMSPDESASRLFKQRTANLVKEMKRMANQLEFMENGYKNGQDLIKEDRGLIGIAFEENPQIKELVISSTLEGLPAQKAGIIPGDVVIKIDEKTTQGMDINQANQSLRGSPETPLTLTIRRGNQELNFQMLRARFGVTSAQRRAELVEVLGFFANYYKNLRERLAINLNKLTTLEKGIAQGQEDPVQSLLSIADDLDRQNAQLDTERDTLIARGRKVFSEGEILKQLDLILSAYFSASPDIASSLNPKELAAMEEKYLNLVESDSQLYPAEKAFFKTYYITITFLKGKSLLFQAECDAIKKLNNQEIFESNRKTAQNMTSSFTNDLEVYRTKLVGDLEKIDALDKGQPFFQKAVKFLISLKYEKDALVASEKSRARAFADLLAARLSSGSEPRSSAKVPTIEEIKQIAKQQNATLVEYAINLDNFQVQDKEQTHESELYIWVIKPTGDITFRKVDLKPLWQQKNTTLADLILSSRQAIGVRGRGGGVVASPDEISQAENLRQLHKLLIQPITNLLPTNPSDRVIFLPQSSLFLVPFPALQDASGKYLIEQHTILTAPAIQVLDLTRQQKVRSQESDVRSGEFLVVGNPTMPKVQFKEGEPAEQLRSLPGAETEAKDIATFLKTQALIGNQATKIAIAQQMPSARIIHLATHGLLDDFKGLGMPGAIALAPSEQDNGLLTASDILDMKLKAELVVLSACDTGRGRISGDGVVGLSRSLISATLV